MTPTLDVTQLVSAMNAVAADSQTGRDLFNSRTIDAIVLTAKLQRYGECSEPLTDYEALQRTRMR